ncbi:hypothetical protein A6764_00020 [Brevibacillus sp. WF146]|uniref:hypothetical protein n=1 Tax=Brevibacillus sp. WF146 TaxID=319501 RepID=UPI0007ED06B3|nr:hypothetical protein [Brevibacillus sp. WF146]UYZ12183.1 hypothetical protein A6764_15265 [Brevibacillus sp. WF146]UYZ13432.1 hypothetical protein A6764_00020 [Brevibacillus sp. WF146]
MTQPKRTRQRRQKPQLSAEEYAYCKDATIRYDHALDERFGYGEFDWDRYVFLNGKLAEWYELLHKRGGVTE